SWVMISRMVGAGPRISRRPQASGLPMLASIRQAVAPHPSTCSSGIGATAPPPAVFSTPPLLVTDAIHIWGRRPDGALPSSWFASRRPPLESFPKTLEKLKLPCLDLVTERRPTVRCGAGGDAHGLAGGWAAPGKACFIASGSIPEGGLGGGG